MKIRLLTPIIFLFATSVGCKKGSENLEQNRVQTSTTSSSGLNIYMPYSVNKDHMVIGHEIAGYHMKYDIAKDAGVFMVLLPNGCDSLKTSPVYFSANTFSLEGGSLKALFENDMRTMLKEHKGAKVIKNLEHTLPGEHGGPCLGAELSYSAGSAEFSYERFYFCDTGSKKYAIFLSMAARTQKDFSSRQEDFVKWMDAPQIVVDAKVHDGE